MSNCRVPENWIDVDRCVLDHVRMDPRRKQIVSEDEYLEFEFGVREKHELINGEIVAMAGGSFRHSLIATNVGTALSTRLATRPCLVFSSDQRVNVSATGMFAYPDVTVVCGRPEYHPKNRDTLRNPLVVVEVLSDSTEGYDRGPRFAHYRELVSLVEIVFVSQDERRVDHFRRGQADEWVLNSVKDEGSVKLPIFDIEVPLAEIYAKLELLPE